MAMKSKIFEQVGENFQDTMETILMKPTNKTDNKKFRQELFDRLESLRNEYKNVEFWFARDLQELFGYKSWNKFLNVIAKAKKACINSGYSESNHFSHVGKMVEIGSETKREIKNIALTRYACYLVAQNGDPRKIEIAFSQTYFAEQTRKFELIEKRIEECERIDARKTLKDHEYELSGIVYKRGFNDSKDFGILRNEGDKGLFGMSTKAIKKKLGIPEDRSLADFLDTVIIKGKDFATAMTAYKIKEENLYGIERISKEHYINNEAVRKALKSRDIIPENVPAKEDIKKVERRLKSDEKKLSKIKGEISSIDIPEIETEKEYKLHIIDISKDLWKIALLIMTTKTAGIITTAELIEEIPKYIVIPDKYKEISEIKNEPKYVQVIRNLKSNKRNKTNFINQGYVTEVRGGYQITQKGLDFVREEFKDYI